MNTLINAWDILETKKKKKFFLIILFFFILSILEVLSIASIIPFFSVIFNVEIIQEFKFLNNYRDLIIENRNLTIFISCVIFFFIFFFKNIFTIFIYKYIYTFLYQLKTDISQKILKKFFQQDYLYFIKNPQGKLTTTLTSEVSGLTDIYFNSIMILSSELIIVLAIFIFILLSDNIEGLIIILPVILCAVFLVKILNTKIKKWGKERVIISSSMIDLTQRIFLGIRDVYFSNNGTHIIKSFNSLCKDQSKIDINNRIIQMLPKSLLEISGLFILLTLVIYFFNKGIPEPMILSRLTFYFIVAYRIIPSFNKILIQYQRLKYSRNSVSIISNVLGQPDERILTALDTDQFNLTKNIKLENYNFYYGENKIFSNLNILINKGECIGIYGKSGCGKSTLLNLISYLLTPKSGHFYLDDKLILAKNDIKKLQNIITFISQDTFLIDDTIKNNIIFNSEKKLNLEKLNNAVSFSKVDSFLKEFENGIEYKVGSHSRKVSSGQKQRISLARGIYNIRQILILDEATNALDETTENEIFQNIKKLKKIHTIIIVSHNKNNLSICDKIYTLENKRLELIDTNFI